MNKFILHLGMPKTGSTYLQNHLFRRLKDIRVIRGWTSLRKIVTTPNNKHLILSDETLSGDITKPHLYDQFDTNVSNLSMLFPNAIILFGIRNHESFILSCFKQSLRNGLVIKLEDYFNAHNSGLLKDEDILFYPRIERLKEVFPRVIIYTIEELKNNEDNIIEEINKSLCIEKIDKCNNIKTKSNEGFDKIGNYYRYYKINKINSFCRKNRLPTLYHKIFTIVGVDFRKCAESSSFWMKSNNENLDFDQATKKYIQDRFSSDWNQAIENKC